MNKKSKDCQIWVADSETDPFEVGLIPAPFIWGVFHGYGDGLYREFTDTDEFVDFVSEQDIIIYAHNGGKFDWHFLSHRFEPDTDLLIINGRLARFNIGKCEFRDSFNLMPVALEQYNKMDFDYTKMHKLYRDDHMDEIRTYLKSDCENLWNMVHGFEKEYGRHITQATAAMKFWNIRLKNKVPRSDSYFYDLIKPFYYGGRVQCFEYGDFTLDAQSIDINSAYPFAMLSPHPYSIHPIEIDGKPRELMDKWGPMFFTIECNAKGAFPYRGTNGSLYFPDDGERRIYQISGWELIAAIETDTADDILFISHMKFDETKDFSEYVNFFWNRRQEFKQRGDKGGEFYCKIFLNSLYGKFGMDPRKHKSYSLHRSGDMKNLMDALTETQSIQNFKEWLILSEQETTGKKRFYNLATAASITGFVRAMLWRSICNAERPLYCDTDSITAKAFGKEITLSKELGDWDLEYNYDRVIVCGKKLYAFHKRGESMDEKKAWKIASKGARLTYEDLIQIAAGQTVQFNNIAPTFSMSKPKPSFVSREIKATASNIRTVPRRFDPKYQDSAE